MSFTTDCILIFHCFVIFGYQKKYLIIPIILCVVMDLGAIVTGIMDAAASMNNTLGIDSDWVNLLNNISNSFVACIALVNFSLTAAIAGRIIWASRGNYGGSSSIDQRTKKRFTTIGAILLESGLLYLLTLAVFVVRDLLEAENFDIGSILTQVSGIAPTLMIVRVYFSGDYFCGDGFWRCSEQR
ncbi:hypothetical protein L218DRAFT_1007051 [Marasmius fiardii PR-910]|nr:hypothetical protein L218DRAFT_1007051 [Marasmius fiardii PR-910]